jgi:hypothetical protein
MMQLVGLLLDLLKKEMKQDSKKFYKN